MLHKKKPLATTVENGTLLPLSPLSSTGSHPPEFSPTSEASPTAAGEPGRNSQRDAVLAEKKDLLNLDFVGSGEEGELEEDGPTTSLLKRFGDRCVHCEQEVASKRLQRALQSRTVLRRFSELWQRAEAAARPQDFSCKFVSNLYSNFLKRKRHQWLFALCVLFALETLAQLIVHAAYRSPASLIIFYAGSMVALGMFAAVCAEKRTWRYTNMIGAVVLLILGAQVAHAIFWGSGARTSTSGMWQCIATVFALHTFFPLRAAISAFFGITLSFLTLVGTIFAASIGREHIWEIAMANGLLLFAINVIGIEIRHVLAEQDLRGFCQTCQVVEITAKSSVQADLERSLLRSMLPDHVFSEMRQALEEGENALSNFHPVSLKLYEPVSILFADIKGFTKMSGTMDASELVTMLNGLFARFDDLSEENGCVRIKLLGDCYFAVSGVPEPCKDHADRCVNLGLKMVGEIGRNHLARRHQLGMRIGVHTGRVLTGVLGRRKWQYDVWSSDVILANHIESGGISGRIHISQATKEQLIHEYEFKEGHGAERDDYLKKHNVRTFFVTASPNNSFKTPNPEVGTENLEATQSLTIPLSGFTRQPFEAMNDDSRTQEIASSLTGIRIREALGKTINSRYEREIQNENLSKGKLSFLNEEWGKDYDSTPDLSFNKAIFMFVPVTLSCAVALLLAYPRKLSAYIVYTFFVVATVVVCVLMGTVHLPERFRKNAIAQKLLEWADGLRARRGLRILLSMFVTNVLFILAAIGMHTCGDAVCKASGATGANCSEEIRRFANDLDPQSEHCYYPEYYVFVFMICSFSQSMLVRAKFIQKLIFWVLTIPAAVLPAITVYDEYFQARQKIQEILLDETDDDFPREVTIATAIAVPFTIILGLVHQRRQEIQLKLDFVWRKHERRRFAESKFKRNRCLRLLHNLMPEDVAKNFLIYRWPTIYHNSHSRCAVLFASVQGFSDFYDEKILDKSGVECLRLLNEIWHDFDDIVNKPEYSEVEKIKMIGSTYMAAAGLQDRDSHAPVIQMILMAFEMIKALQAINEHSYQDFKLRVGINVGPLVSGVIGAKKPLFDIWGDTVNLASRMDSTGINGKIQVTKAVYRLIRDDFVTEPRWPVYVKGKGKIQTYIVKAPICDTAV